MTTNEEAWNTLVAAAKEWAARMDQWEKFKFQTDYGTIYVTMSRKDQWPDSFDEVP